MTPTYRFLPVDNESTIDSMPDIEPVILETDEEIIERLRKRFTILDDMTKAVKKGYVKAMIVSGPPGVGKSFGVEKVLNTHQFLADISGDETLKNFEIVKGSMTALGLYTKLYEFSDPKNILVFDDADGIFFDDVSLNILKAALDSSKSRRISWLSDSRLLKQECIPNSFEFKGGVVFITNLKFENVKSKKLQDHLAALESRCHYLDLTIDTEREKMLRITQIVKDGMLDDYNLSDDDKEEIIQYIDTNKKKLRELSLRTVLKVADLHRSFRSSWKEIADMTVLRR